MNARTVLDKLTPRVRAYLYRALLAAGAVAAFYGLISGDELAVWAGFAATVLGTGTAAAHTSTR